MAPRTELWHQRLAWLLMLYVLVGLATFREALHGEATRIDLLTNVLIACAIVMVCAKDAALAGRPPPYSWRQPVLLTWPVSVVVLILWARRWRGLLWIGVHSLLLCAVAVVAIVIGEMMRPAVSPDL